MEADKIVVNKYEIILIMMMLKVAVTIVDDRIINKTRDEIVDTIRFSAINFCKQLSNDEIEEMIKLVT
jgi:hypothetical protein